MLKSAISAPTFCIGPPYAQSRYIVSCQEINIKEKPFNYWTPIKESPFPYDKVNKSKRLDDVSQLVSNANRCNKDPYICVHKAKDHSNSIVLKICWFLHLQVLFLL